MRDETFSMSKFANKEDLYKAKAEYFEDKYKSVLNKYQQLIMEVQMKIPDESRHETARRYIKERESRSCGPATEG